MTRHESATAGEALKQLQLLDAKIKWISCPMCGDEVNRLRPCVFWGPGQTVSHVCIECAESVKGLTFLAGLYPIFGVDVQISPMPHYASMPVKYQSERTNQARVSYSEWGFTVWPETTKLVVLEDRKPMDQKVPYDNTHQVWFSLKKQFEEGPKEEAAATKGGWKV